MHWCGWGPLRRRPGQSRASTAGEAAPIPKARLCLRCGRDRAAPHTQLRWELCCYCVVEAAVITERKSCAPRGLCRAASTGTGTSSFSILVRFADTPEEKARCACVAKASRKPSVASLPRCWCSQVVVKSCSPASYAALVGAMTRMHGSLPVVTHACNAQEAGQAQQAVHAAEQPV